MIEVTLAIGIMGFAFISVFGLLPVGMTTFRRSMDINAGSQIAQRVINDAQQADFAELVKDASGAPITGTNATGLKTVRYFDDQGNELAAAQSSKAIYHVNTRITPATSFPKAVGGTPDNPNLATVTVQIANNPGNQPLDSSASTKLWTGAYKANPSKLGVVPIVTYCAMVARNK